MTDDRPCPRCAAPLVGAGRLTCGRCGGAFLEPAEVRALLRALTDPAAARARRATYRDAPRPVEISRKRVVDDVARYLACPRCADRMSRTRVHAKSGVIADVCPPHGLWLDAGEADRLAQVFVALAQSTDGAEALDEVDAVVRALANRGR